MSKLVANIDTYITNKYRVLFIGDHGVGKTAVAIDAAKRHGLKLKYYSCATLDPFTDLVGVPFPRTHDGVETLSMIRPRELDEAEFIFFDELNRADEKVQNAVLEIIQFGTINGEPLPRLQHVWAAINPFDEELEYKVDSLDPALVDRFDVYEEIKPAPSVQYLAGSFGDQKVAAALVSWWRDHNRSTRSKSSYVSPRRLEKVGKYIVDTGRTSDIAKLLPPGGTYDTKKLALLLSVALGKTSPKKLTNPASAPASAAISYKTQDMVKDPKKVASVLKRKNVSSDTQMKVVDALIKGTGIGPGKAVALKPVWEALPGSMVEQVVNSWTPSKKAQMRSHLRSPSLAGTPGQKFRSALGY